MEYSIKIDEFEGPLDLLLHLIKKDNIDINEISIERITNQYLDYLNKWEELNITVASSYLVMAAELLELKSKSLLPQSKIENDDDEEEENTKENLINKLLLYQKYKDVTTVFKDMEENRLNYYIKSPENIYNYIEDSTIINNNNDNSVNDLYQAFVSFLERKEQEKPLNTKITTKEYSMKDRKKSIKEVLIKKNKVMFEELFEEYDRGYIIITFLSILEMVKDREIIIKQEDNFGHILIELEVK